MYIVHIYYCLSYTLIPKRSIEGLQPFHSPLPSSLSAMNWIFLVGFRILLFLRMVLVPYTRAVVGHHIGKNNFVFSFGRLIFFVNPITVDGRFKCSYVGDFHHRQSKRPLAEMTSVDIRTTIATTTNAKNLTGRTYTPNL